jgi:hypothetical protein
MRCTITSRSIISRKEESRLSPQSSRQISYNNILPPHVCILDSCFGQDLPSLALLLRQLGVVLGEALAQALRLCHLLLNAPCDAASLPVRKRLGGEVVDARYEAVVY